MGTIIGDQPTMPLGEDIFISRLLKHETELLAETEVEHFKDYLLTLNVAEYKKFIDALGDELSRLTDLKSKLSRVASIARGVVLR